MGLVRPLVNRMGVAWCDPTKMPSNEAYMGFSTVYYYGEP